MDPALAPTPPPPHAPPPPATGLAALLAPGPLPARGPARILFGAAQPLLGLRVVLREPALRRRAALPLLALLALCGLVAYGKPGAAADRLDVFLDTMVYLAPLPVVLFGKTYRRLAADARPALGLSPGTAVAPRLLDAARDAVRQSLLLALALVPLYILLDLVTGAGDGDLAGALVWLCGGAWALYWIVVEALDNGRTNPTAAPIDEAAIQGAAPDPWFVRVYELGPLRRFANLLRRLSRPWRSELALVARHPDLALGFGLGVAALLAVPLMALVVRPAAVVGAVHLLGRVAEAEQA